MIGVSPFAVAAVQAAPVYLDRDATVDKAISLIEQAARGGARLVGFPECYVPGYPWWVWLDSPAWGLQFVRRYFENAMEIGDEVCARLCRAARDNRIFVVMGFVERAGGSLYIAQMLIDDQGRLVHARRKLRVTHAERTVFGEGDGSDLAVHGTPLGRLGALSCWEHLNPLVKYAMFAQGEQLHVASWPSFTLYVGQAHALGAELNLAINKVYAAEGQCFVVVASNLLSEEMQQLLCDTPLKQDLLGLGGGIAQIFGPDGKELATPLGAAAEGLVFAEVDLGQIALAKAAADPIGHYSRPDVLQLLFDNRPQRRVVLNGAGRGDGQIAERPVRLPAVELPSEPLEWPPHRYRHAEAASQPQIDVAVGQ
jgi:aliphatic nitrilase